MDDHDAVHEAVTQKFRDMFKKKRTISNTGLDEILKNRGYHRQDTENTVIEKYTK